MATREASSSVWKAYSCRARRVTSAAEGKRLLTADDDAEGLADQLAIAQRAERAGFEALQRDRLAHRSWRLARNREEHVRAA